MDVQAEGQDSVTVTPQNPDVSIFSNLFLRKSSTKSLLPNQQFHYHEDFRKFYYHELKLYLLYLTEDSHALGLILEDKI